LLGTQSAKRFNHYSLHTAEEMLGLPDFLGGAASATSMRSGVQPVSSADWVPRTDLCTAPPEAVTVRCFATG